MYFTLWFVLGLLFVAPLLLFAQRLRFKTMVKLMGRSLIIAALIYIGFALLWGNTEWLVIEVMGVALYGLFYWLALRHSALWLSLGWLLHPLWDVMLHMLGPGAHVVPDWYAIACVSFDLAAALYIVYRIELEKRLTKLESA
ncbi:MAG: hypothetical protein AseanaTS_03440 [Candidatus Pelagadaptatus aseana]|uniref:DUF6010 family protein n=1 Tax=Candidatus Pelagadaptatus aseana TaxID=3120508 RepID=UPI0039B1E75C